MRVLPNVIVRRPSAPHEDAPNTHKENAVNAAPAPVYFSTKPGGPPLVMPVGDVPPLQGSKFRGVLTVRNVEPPGAVAINTCHKNIFCPEICPEIQEAPGAAAIKPATHQILRQENLLQFWRWTLLNLKHDAFTTSAGQRKSDSKVGGGVDVKGSDDGGSGLFSTVLIITDRLQLDRQLGDTGQS